MIAFLTGAIIFKYAFNLIIKNVFGASLTGKYGEKLIEKELKELHYYGKDGKVLRNVYIPKENGETSEIDVLYITQKGIFVIESKNYSGWVFGDEKSEYWTVMLPNKEKNKLYNPIKQNKTHLKWLSNYLVKDIPLYSIIVFSERCELKKITVDNTNIYVIQRNDLCYTIKNIWDNVPEILNNKDVEEIYNKLFQLTNVDEAIKQAHINNISKKYNKQIDNEKESITENNFTEHVCPKCGGKLILRTAKKGDNIGKQFYGCSNYPKCRYIEDLFEN